MVANISVNFLPANIVLKFCHQNFTTFFTMQFTISKEICHQVVTLGAISCNIQMGGISRYKWEAYGDGNGKRLTQ